MVAKAHHRTTNRRGQKVLQPAGSAGVSDIRRLVGWPSGFCRWNGVSEEDRWIDVRSSGGDVVVNRGRIEGKEDMATREISTISTTPPAPRIAAAQDYSRPLAIVTTLFFMWGFLTCLNDILVPHLKSIFDLSYTKVMLIQFAFFGAYFLFSIPSAKIIDWIGYQRSMVLGLLTMGAGAFLFVPAAM